MKTIVALFGVVIATMLTIAMLFTAGWVHPPILGTQVGFRGLALNQLITPAAKSKLSCGASPSGGDRAGVRRMGRRPPRSTRTSRF